MPVLELALDPAWIALIGTIFGGAGLKIAESYLNKNKVKIDDARSIRDELRLQDAQQKEEIKDLEAEVDKWRTNYYDLRDKYSALQTDLTLALHNIKNKNLDAQERPPLPLPPTPPPEDVIDHDTENRTIPETT